MNHQTAHNPPSPWLGWIPILAGLILGLAWIFLEEALAGVALALEIVAAPAIAVHLLRWRRTSKRLGRLIARGQNPRFMAWISGSAFVLSLAGIAWSVFSANPLARVTAVLAAAGSAELFIDVLIGTEFRELGVASYRWSRRWDELTGFRWDQEADDYPFVNLALLTTRRPLINFPRRSELGASVRRSQHEDVTELLKKRIPASPPPDALQAQGST